MAIRGEQPDHVLDPLHFAAVRRPLLQAESLPPWCYMSEAFYAREARAIFGRGWNFVGHADQLAGAGAYVTGVLAGVPFIVVRGADGIIRGFANTCRHRGALLMEGTGQASAIRCPYHSWTYDLTGRLRGAAVPRVRLRCDQRPQ